MAFCLTSWMTRTSPMGILSENSLSRNSPHAVAAMRRKKEKMEKEGMHARRNPYPDILKGMAILLVILGHCIQFGSGSAYEAGAFFQSNSLFIWIYSFHMPLFMILAGYFAAGSLQRYTGIECIVRRIRSLVIPIFTWSVVYEIYAWGSMLLRGEDIQVSTLPGAWLQYFSAANGSCGRFSGIR